MIGNVSRGNILNSPLGQPILFIPHGGGPLPLYNQDSISRFLTHLNHVVSNPLAILVISAHWEAKEPTIVDNPEASLLYDYYGFPAETYHYQYSAPSASKQANSLLESLLPVFPEACIERNRGWDHGVFVPLKLMVPEANIPVFQLSLLSDLDSSRHMLLGEQLQSLSDQGILIVGSGFSFHNMQVFMNEANQQDKIKSKEFDRWLNDTLTNQKLSALERKSRLTNWELAPHARYCHPREEHLLPLHVCVAAAGYRQAKNIFNEATSGVISSGFLWC